MQDTSRGFTLIELIVVIGISMVMVGGAVAGYNNFNHRQQIIQSGKQFGSVIREAQKRASVGDKQAVCNADRLRWYEIFAVTGSNVFTLRAQCEGAGIALPPPINIQEYTLQGTATLTGINALGNPVDVNIQFESPSGRIKNFSADQVFRISEQTDAFGNTSTKYLAVTVTVGGSVTVADTLIP